MQPVDFSIEVNNTYGCYGFSFLQNPLCGGSIQRKTVYFIRDLKGEFQSALILDAKVVR